MKNKSISLLFVFLIFNSIYASYMDTKVIEVTEDNFDDQVLTSNKIWFINFYSKDCKESSNLEEPFTKTAGALNDIYEIQFGAINVDENKNLKAKYNITKTPTLLFFGQQKEKATRQYRGKRTVEGLLNYLTEESLYAVFKKTGQRPYRFNYKREIAEFKRNLNNVLSPEDIEALRLEKLEEEKRSKEISSKKSKNFELEEGVAILTDDNFDELVMKNEDEVAFVLFYAPWCGHCKALKPKWRTLATTLKGKALIAQVDCTKETKVAGRFTISGYPTLIKFPKGKKSDKTGIEYSGAREIEDLEKFIDQKVEKEYEEKKEEKETINLDEKKDVQEKKYETEGDVALLTDINFDEVVKNTKEAVFILFYAPWCGHCKALKPKWKDLATKLKGKALIAQVDCTKETKLAGRFSVSGYPTLKKFGKGSKRVDTAIIDYDGEREIEDLEEFILEIEDDTPIDETYVTKMEQEQFDSILSDQENMYFAFFYDEKCDKKCEKAMRPFSQLATQYKNKKQIKFIKMDLTNAPKISEQYEIKKYPTLAWLPEGVKNKDTIDIYSGSTKLPKLKEYADEKEKDKPTPDVVIITDENFDDIVMYSEKLVFLKAYAPWCGHCKALKPTWGELATNFKDNEDVIIAKIDATKHRKALEKFEVKGYPTLLLFPYGDKTGVKPINYEGDRNYQDLENYVFTKLLEAKPLNIPQITSQENFDKQCKKSTIRACFIAILPHIYDSNAEERNTLIKELQLVAESNKKTYISFSWIQAGDYFEFEENLNLSSGFPLFMVYTEKKNAVAIMKGSFKEKHINQFVERILGGRENIVKITKTLPTLSKVKEWDGLDAKPVIDSHEEL